MHGLSLNGLWISEGLFEGRDAVCPMAASGFSEGGNDLMVPIVLLIRDGGVRPDQPPAWAGERRAAGLSGFSRRMT